MTTQESGLLRVAGVALSALLKIVILPAATHSGLPRRLFHSTHRHRTSTVVSHLLIVHLPPREHEFHKGKDFIRLLNSQPAVWPAACGQVFLKDR